MADLEAKIKISAVKYSNTAAKNIGAEFVTINLEYPKLRKNFSDIERGKIIPAFPCLLPPLLEMSLLNVFIDFSPSLIEFAARSPEKMILIALETSLSDIVFFFANSVSFITK